MPDLEGLGQEVADGTVEELPEELAEGLTEGLAEELPEELSEETCWDGAWHDHSTFQEVLELEAEVLGTDLLGVEVAAEAFGSFAPLLLVPSAAHPVCCAAVAPLLL